MALPLFPLIALLAAPAVGAPVFGCSFGAKSVQVTASGASLVYRYGSRGRTEISLERPMASSDIGHHYQLFAHAEHRHLRLANGRQSYILYDRFSAAAYDHSGAEDEQGLLVLSGGRIVARHRCRSGPGFARDFRFEQLRQDGDDLAELADPSDR